ncbi:MAG TPA: LPXTG cell wall anchor domain-containing protein [Erysipelothrix sp.]|nr:LPXTG cell wall anchor domain-containing protein [Erysipelothrix sp.]
MTVTDDGEGTLTAEVKYVGVDAVEFENTYSETSGEGVDKPDLPETGSSNNMLLSLMGFVLMIGGLFLVKKRPE